MPRRVSLPGAAELFRVTPTTKPDPAGEHHPSAAASPNTPATGPQDQQLTGSPEATGDQVDHPGDQPAEPPAEESVAGPEHESAPARTTAKPATEASPRGSGRVRHDEKITVYVSSDELLDLERARLSLRAEHGMAVDRGRIVREALAMVIGDLAARGADSDLVRRLSRP